MANMKNDCFDNVCQCSSLTLCSHDFTNLKEKTQVIFFSFFYFLFCAEDLLNGQFKSSSKSVFIRMRKCTIIWKIGRTGGIVEQWDLWYASYFTKIVGFGRGSNLYQTWNIYIHTHVFWKFYMVAFWFLLVLIK